MDSFLEFNSSSIETFDRSTGLVEVQLSSSQLQGVCRVWIVPMERHKQPKGQARLTHSHFATKTQCECSKTQRMRRGVVTSRQLPLLQNQPGEQDPSPLHTKQEVRESN
jgi:hypothetical protein